MKVAGGRKSPANAYGERSTKRSERSGGGAGGCRQAEAPTAIGGYRCPDQEAGRDCSRRLTGHSRCADSDHYRGTTHWIGDGYAGSGDAAHGGRARSMRKAGGGVWCFDGKVVCFEVCGIEVMIAILFTTYGAVFVAEIVGDKLLYTTGVLATRYRTVPVMIGMLIAFMAKMAVAVAVGSAIAKLPPLLVAALTSISFIGVAITLWRKPVERSATQRDPRAAKGALVSLLRDLSFGMGRCWPNHGRSNGYARFGAPLLVWAGAVGDGDQGGACCFGRRGDSTLDRRVHSRRRWCGMPGSSRCWCWGSFRFWKRLRRVTRSRRARPSGRPPGFCPA